MPEFAIVYGNPARARGWACHCGTALRFEAAVSGQPSAVGPAAWAGDPDPRACCSRCGSCYLMRDGIAVMEERVMPKSGR